MNPEGAMFCSNCSSILRSRRSAAPSKAPEPSKPVNAEEGATRRIPVTAPAKAAPEPKAAAPVFEAEERYSPRKNTYSTKRAAAIPEPSRKRPSYYDDYEDEPAETVKFCSAWCNVLAVVSWVIFIALMAVGIIGGAVLILMGVKQGESMMYFGGTAVAILFVILALAYHAKNMVQIKILRKFNEKR